MRFDRLTILHAALAFVVCAVAPALSAADVIDLVTGEHIRGTVKRTTAKGIVIEVGGRERTIEQRLVRGIAFELAPATAPAAASTPQAAAPKAQPPASAPAPAPPLSAAPEGSPPRLEIVLAKLSPPALREAMQALADLRASAVEGVSQADWAARVDGARPRVEAYVRDAEDPRSNVKKALASAMRLYSFASAAWTVYVSRGDFTTVGRDPALAECPRLRQAIEQDAANWHFRADDPGFAGLIAGSEGLRDLWTCAADRLGEAEQLLADQKP